MPVKFYPRNIDISSAIALDPNAHGYRHAIFVNGVPYVLRHGRLIRSAW